VISKSDAPQQSRRPLWPDDYAPENIEAEMVVLCSLIMADERLYGTMRPCLRSEMFLSPDNLTIFQAVIRRRDSGDNCDGMILRQDLIESGLFEQVGGVEYLAAIVSAAPNASSGMTYLKMVTDAYRLRGIDRLAKEASAAVRMPRHGREDKAAEIIAKMQNGLAALAQSTAPNDIRTLGDVMETTLSEMRSGGAPRIPTGIGPLDEKIGGVGVGEMSIIAARPSMGKSLLGKQIASSMAMRQPAIPIFYCNCEESNKKTARNWLSANARIPNHRVRRGNLTKEEWEAAEDWKKHSQSLPFHMSETAIKLSEVCGVISLAHARFGIKVAFVDYIQLIEPEAGDTRQEQVADVSRSLKNLFKRLGIAGVVLAQLNRGNESGHVIRRPRLSDLRDTGQLDQDADLVMLLHRPDFYARETGGDPNGKVEVIIAKARDDSREGDVTLQADLEHQTFLPVLETPY